MIRANNIFKSYNNNEVLKGIDLVCDKGKIQVLLGANGAGKSTLINILSGIIEQDSGGFNIDNEEININSYKYRNKVGYVFENPIYIEKFSAYEYFEFVARMYKIPKNERKIRIPELISFFELPNDNSKYIENYSKGMQSKVSLAAALINNPKYLILDEPFDGVDFISVQKISNLFKDLTRKGTTILITSHQFDIIFDICDNFALLKDGKISFNVSLEILTKMANNYSDDKNPIKSFLENQLKSGNSIYNLTYLEA
jgi:ABC-2 type transport system ATP-binding protein